MYEIGQIILKKFMNEAKNYQERNLFPQQVCNVSNPVEKCFDQQIEPHWRVPSFFGVTDIFRAISTKIPVLRQKKLSVKFS